MITRSEPGRPAASTAPACISLKPATTASRNRCPAGVRVTPDRDRSNNRVDSCASSAAMRRLSADCEVRSSPAAPVKLPLRAALSKAINALIDGIR